MSQVNVCPQPFQLQGGDLHLPRILQTARENSQLSTQNMTLKSGVVWGDFQLTPVSLVSGKDPPWLMEDFS